MASLRKSEEGERRKILPANILTTVVKFQNITCGDAFLTKLKLSLSFPRLQCKAKLSKGKVLMSLKVECEITHALVSYWEDVAGSNGNGNIHNMAEE